MSSARNNISRVASSDQSLQKQKEVEGTCAISHLDMFLGTQSKKALNQVMASFDSANTVEVQFEYQSYLSRLVLIAKSDNLVTPLPPQKATVCLILDQFNTGDARKLEYRYSK